MNKPMMIHSSTVKDTTNPGKKKEERMIITFSVYLFIRSRKNENCTKPDNIGLFSCLIFTKFTKRMNIY